MDFYYTDERNVQIIIALLKAHSIKKVIVSPGGTNICFVASIQQDSYFEIYSAADERSAAYMACGMAAELGGKEAIVLNCTGATASRNYMPALTEAYYRKLPILIITSSKRNYEIGHNVDQVTDRTLLPRDIAKLSVQISVINDKESEWACIIAANKAMLELFHNSPGPVHINLETTFSRAYNIKVLPDAKVIHRYTIYDQLPELNAFKIAVMVGAHLEFNETETVALEKFCELNNAIVLCDHTSNYCGKYRVFPYLASIQINYIAAIKKADLVIHIGDISASDFDINMSRVWRVNPDGELRDTYKKLECVFEMKESYFFKYYSKECGQVRTSFYEACISEQNRINDNIPELPFSNAWIAMQTADKLPNNSVLHLGIRNSLRFWNCFEKDLSILGFSNTGGFGIDGCLSSAIGASLINKNKIFYCILGDLAFFYDMNSLGNRHISNNLRIVLINNGGGAEFWLSSSAASLFGKYTDDFIAAAGHYGNKSRFLVKHYAEDLGFKYFPVSTKSEYLEIVDELVSPETLDKSILVEVFTNSIDEDKALKMLSHIEQNNVEILKNSIKKIGREIIGESGVNVMKRIIK